jgi:zinc transport system ATP-binding protein
MIPILELNSVTKKFSGKTVVEGISFKIYTSTINVLVGPNGAGKSTIAKILGGILKPCEGQIIEHIKLKKTYIPQQTRPPYSLPLTCSEYARIQNIKKEDIINGFYESEDSLDKIWNKQLNEISSGQAQFFMLSTAFAYDSDIIILDEPTSFLDVDFEAKFYEKLKDLVSKRKTSIFMISHELHSVVNSAHQVLCINHHICCSGKPVFSNDSIKSNIGTYKHSHNHTHS